MKRLRPAPPWAAAVAAAALGFAAPLFAGAARAESAAAAEALWARCAVCHQPNGEGIPGAFPPISAQVRALAAQPAGREYLVLVITRGLIGAITVEGVAYRSAMPAQQLGDAELSALLNYLAAKFGAAEAAEFGADEVAEIRAAHPRPTHAELLERRAELLQ